MPTDCAAMPMRPPSRPDSAIFRPWPSSPSRLVRRHAAVLEQDLRRVAGVLAHLVFDAGDDVAGRVVGTMKALMPFLPAALSVTAITIATSPFLPLVMNCLTPLST